MTRLMQAPMLGLQGEKELCQPEVTLTSRLHIYRGQMRHLIPRNLSWGKRMNN